jgi:glycosyltransferase involved in cell wall biosynthesis
VTSGGGRGLSVVLYTETTARGGAEVAMRNLIGALDETIHATVMGVDRSVCEWIASARAGCEVVIVPAVRNKASVGAFLAHRRAIRRLRPDVFHANLRTMADAQYAVLAALTVRGTAVLTVEQLPLPPTTRLSRWLNRRTGRRLAAHVAVGERTSRLVEQAYGFPAGTVASIYNGVPDEGAIAAPAGGAGVVTALTLARLDHIKGLDVLLDAAAPLTNLRVVMAGEGPERESLLQRARSLGSSDRVDIRPWVDDPRELLASCDFFVLPSRNEGFPLSIVEAMLAGRAVVATDVGSVAEAVVDGVTGFVVAPDDVEALRGALDRLASDTGLRRSMGVAGRDRAVERFTATAMARGFEALYREITTGA